MYYCYDFLLCVSKNYMSYVWYNINSIIIIIISVYQYINNQYINISI